MEDKLTEVPSLQRGVEVNYILRVDLNLVSECVVGWHDIHVKFA